jgi:hypothetical protein
MTVSVRPWEVQERRRSRNAKRFMKWRKRNRGRYEENMGENDGNRKD